MDNYTSDEDIDDDFDTQLIIQQSLQDIHRSQELHSSHLRMRGNGISLAMHYRYSTVETCHKHDASVMTKTEEELKEPKELSFK